MIHELAQKRGIPVHKRPLWTDKWDEKALRKRQDDISKRAFDKGYRQKAITDVEFMFPSFVDCIKYGLSIELAANKENLIFISTGVDLSSKTRAGNVIFTIGVRNDHKRVPLDVKIGHWTSPQVARKLAEVYDSFRPHVILVENNAYQGALIEWIQSLPEENQFWMMVMPYVTGKQKWTDDIGLPSLEAEFNSSGWIIPMKERHLLDCKCDWCTWMNDMRYYPQVGEADTVMACWFAREGIRLYMGGNVKESIEIPKKADEFQDVFKILNIDPKDYDFL